MLPVAGAALCPLLVIIITVSSFFIKYPESIVSYSMAAVCVKAAQPLSPL